MTSRHLQHSRHSRNRAAARAADRSGRRKQIAGAALVLAALALAWASVRDAHATTYKWTDERGVVHYSDKIPVDAVNREHVELDRQGIRVRKTDRALTAEQIRARAAEAERQKQVAKVNEEVDRRDRALVATYSREEDIDLARSRSLTTIDGQLQSARMYAAQLTKRQTELAGRKLSFGNKPVPPAIERELESIDSELAKTNALIDVKKRESLAVAARYDADRQRYRELRAMLAQDAASGKAAAAASAQVGGSGVNVIPTSAVR
jgi:hypothetical protein